ncbi:MAG: hypothetical protein JO362_13475 [Streptomycetaceae bacterium]|nr:hypothetical protein [Streptomycetaceae bacterium]
MAAVCAGLAVAGALFASQASAQPGTKNVVVYTDQSVGCVWVGTGKPTAKTYISTGYTAGWRGTGIQAAVGATVTAKTYTTDCAAVQGLSSFASKQVNFYNAPSNLQNLWLNTDSASTGTVRVSVSSLLPQSNNFVMFSNRSGFAPYACLSAWYTYDYVPPRSQYVPPLTVIDTPESPPDLHECKRLGGGGHHVFWLPQSPRGFDKIRLMVSPTGTVFGKKYFDLALDRSSCFRETSSGSVHEATDKPCTSD